MSRWRYLLLYLALGRLGLATVKAALEDAESYRDDQGWHCADCTAAVKCLPHAFDDTWAAQYSELAASLERTPR